jgi:hypothetical protein
MVVAEVELLIPLQLFLKVETVAEVMEHLVLITLVAESLQTVLTDEVAVAVEPMGMELLEIL